ncbi:CDP-diacylglycerol---serine O-phosphatidyltransferase [uncultured Gammaproteobacteria bacterium]
MTETYPPDPQARAPLWSKFPILRLVPNTLTMLALISGLGAIYFALHAQWRWAVYAIMLAAVLDVLDGGAARLFKCESRFGARLDSISDGIGFGIAPAVMMWAWVLKDAGIIGALAAVVFALCSAARLARFMIMSANPNVPAWTKGYFTGVPTPMGAGLGLLPMALAFQSGHDTAESLLVAGWLVFVGVLMISRLPTPSLKGRRIARVLMIPVALAFGLLVTSLVINPWLTLVLADLAYLISLPGSRARYLARARKEEEKAAAGTP